jgi:colicin import membrane protein
VIQGESPFGQPQTAAITGGATLTAASSGSPSSSSSVAAAGGNASGGTDAENEALGKQMAAAAPYNWTGAEWTALNNIVMAESGWSDTVTNPSSTAAGIAQNIAGFGPDYESGNASQQIAWLLAYIKSRYGTPVIAWAFHLANGWY